MRVVAVAKRHREEMVLAAKYGAVSLLGFVTDVVVLRIMLHFGALPAWARVVSLICAMHVTFVINGLHVFHGLDWSCWRPRWISYMTTNGFGNVCNYWIFVTLVSSHWRFISAPVVAVAIASAVAWTINYVSTRFLVFRRDKRPLAADLDR
jgi:putative flippase GtrA